MHDHEIDLKNVVTLKDCLFGAVKLSKTIIQDPGYGIRFESCSLFSILNSLHAGKGKKNSEFLGKIQRKD